jgi:hypothetical protein
VSRLRPSKVHVATHLEATHAQTLYKWPPQKVYLSAHSCTQTGKFADPTFRDKMTVSMELLLTLSTAVAAGKEPFYVQKRNSYSDLGVTQ